VGLELTGTYRYLKSTCTSAGIPYEYENCLPV
jgi:hypothetical protein